jgi:hypothetical protein
MVWLGWKVGIAATVQATIIRFAAINTSFATLLSD